MPRSLVYDWPTRLFHWLFAGFFITAFAISNLVDDESARFSLHMLAGMGMVCVIVLRLVWALVGTRHARLSDLALNPLHLLAYFRGMLTGGKRLWPGHNPASSWAAVAMVSMGIGLGATGYLMATGMGSDIVEELHELLANALLVVALLHVGGVVVHMLRNRDRLAASMLTGYKHGLENDHVPVRSRPHIGLAFVVLTGLSMGYLLQQYDARARTLDLFGNTLQLGEGEHDEESDGGDEREYEDD